MQYETMFIVSSELEEKDKDKKIDEIKTTLTKFGATILHEAAWGKRKLAYPIKKEKHGYFGILNFESEPETLLEIQEKLKFMDHLLRFMIIKMPFVKESAKKATAPKTETELAEEKKQAVVESVVESTEKKLKEKAVSTKKKEVKEEKEKVSKEPVNIEELDKKLDEILQDDMNV